MLEKALHPTPLTRAAQKPCQPETPGGGGTAQVQLVLAKCGRTGGGGEAVSRGPVHQVGAMPTWDAYLRSRNIPNANSCPIIPQEKGPHKENKSMVTKGERAGGGRWGGRDKLGVWD